jgi:hypothetical protein
MILLRQTERKRKAIDGVTISELMFQNVRSKGDALIARAEEATSTFLIVRQCLCH